MIKLSIIITAYNAEPYIHELLDVLEPQITEEVEVIVIDDGSDIPLDIKRTWLKFYTNDGNKGISYSRNRGLDLASGICIHYIDADDLVPANYVKYVLNLINTREFDYIDLSWKSLPGGGAQCNFKLNSDNDKLPNPSASTRIFTREFIGDTRFNENKDAAEDEDFTRHLGIKHAKRICATEYMYFYRTYVPNSNSKLYFSGMRNTHKVGFYYNHVASYDILERVKEADKYHEPVVLTNKNDIPELEKYATVICPPVRTKVMEAYGEKCNYFSLIPVALKANLVIYVSIMGRVGGVETFICNFCENMHKKYDILVLYEQADENHLGKITKYVRCAKLDPKSPVTCETLLMIRINDKIPSNINYTKVLQTVHCVKQQTFVIPQERDAIICVSDSAKKSFGTEASDAKVINNLISTKDTHRSLILVSATRIGASDKGKNDERMRRMARLLKEHGIKFVWLYFGTMPIHNPPEGLIYMGIESDMTPWFKMADYVVQLSDVEAFSYTLLEALCLNTPVIVTPLESNTDMGIKDGLNAYIVPFDFDKTYDFDRFLSFPKFNFSYDNDEIISQWIDVIDNTKPGDRQPKDFIKVKIITRYNDIQLGRIMAVGDTVWMPKERAAELVDKGLVDYL